jgi:lantibiotic modifying enzyme
MTQVYESCLIESLFNFSQDDMFVGRCGFIMGLQYLNRELGTEVISEEDMTKLGHVIIKSGRKYTTENKLSIPLMYQYHGREYLGAAHGISAILFSLLSIKLSESDSKDLKTTIDCILALQDETGNFPSKFNKSEAHLIHWCHGAPGVVYLMAKAYKVYNEQKYLDSCVRCGELVWEKGLLKVGVSLIHICTAC